MPEGPSIVILKEAVESFTGKKVTAAAGNTKKIDLNLIKGKKIVSFKSFGKNFFICFPKFSLRIHFLLFGSYRVNESKETPARLSLFFKDGEIHFYACVVQQIDESLDNLYDWTADVMNESWDAKAARTKLKLHPDTMVCDILLDQNVFAGVGNIIKNEVLYRIKVHPQSLVYALPLRKRNELIKEAVIYSFEFFEWKKQYTLKKHWLAHTKKVCKRCDLPIIKEYTGKTNRRSFFCTNCQVLHI